MSKKLQDFIKNWKVNVKNLSAMHRTGVGFKKILNLSNHPEIEVLNMQAWISKQISEGFSFSECENKLNDLQNEFDIIDNEILSHTRQRFTSMNYKGR